MQEQITNVAAVVGVLQLFASPFRLLSRGPFLGLPVTFYSCNINSSGCGGIAVFCVRHRCVRHRCVCDRFALCLAFVFGVVFVFVRAEPEMEGLLCDLLWADPSDDPGVTNIEALSDQVYDTLGCFLFVRWYS